MKCPIVYRLKYFPDHSIDNEASDCLQAECAWWSSLSGRCSVQGIDEELHWIAERLNALIEKMPHEEQFRK